jgi:hypothetical protein
MAFMQKAMYGAMVWTLLSLYACGHSMPLQEISDAHQAIETAQENKVESQLPHSLEQARRYLLQAEVAMSVGETTLAKDQALSAKQSALWVYQTAEILQQTQVVLSGQNPAHPDIIQSQQLIEQAISACEQEHVIQGKQLASQALEKAQKINQP